MAERRMFAKTIVTSDAFLDLPMSSRCLYFTLGMFADDDGFVNNPKSIMRQVGATLDDMNVLIAKKFVITFESGVIVIKHWKIHNYIRGDRKHTTKYVDELSMLDTDDNGAYTVDVCPSNDGQLSGRRYTEDRLGKDSISNNNIITSKDASNYAEEFAELWGIYPKYRKQGKKKAFDHYKKARKSGTTFEEIRKGLEAYIRYIEAERIETKYIKQAATFFSQAAWNDEWTTKNPLPENADDLEGIL